MEKKRRREAEGDIEDGLILFDFEINMVLNIGFIVDFLSIKDC